MVGRSGDAVAASTRRADDGARGPSISKGGDHGRKGKGREEWKTVLTGIRGEAEADGMAGCWRRKKYGRCPCHEEDRMRAGGR